MTEKEKEELREIVKDSIQSSVKEQVQLAIHNELGQYKVPKEQHYKDHLFLQDWIKWTESIKSSFWKSIISGLTKFLLFILFLGFIAWIVLVKGNN